MFRIVIYILISVFLVTSCGKPNQPGLTKKEQLYFIELSKQFNCAISREVNPKAIKFNNVLHKEGWYLLKLDSLQCISLENMDSLKIESYKMARKLFREILDDSFKFNFKDITIVFECQDFPHNFMRQSFSYELNELK